MKYILVKVLMSFTEALNRIVEDILVTAALPWPNPVDRELSNLEQGRNSNTYCHCGKDGAPEMFSILNMNEVEIIEEIH